MTAQTRQRPRSIFTKATTIAIIASAVFLVIGANAHLVYVAVRSQPDCVPHDHTTGTGQTYRAAKSSC